MSIIERKLGTITIDEIANHEMLDEKFFRNIRMDGDKVLRKFSKQFNDTKAKVLDNIEVQYVIEGYNIEKISGDTVALERGIQLECSMLSKVLEKSENVYFSVITVHGYDELEDNAADTMEMLFLDGWGTAALSCAHDILKKNIKRYLEQENIITTSEWNPGQHQVNIKLQNPIFDNLKPEDIGVTLSKTYMMKPKKSESGITGFGHDMEQSQLEPCDVCPRRETCPSAHGSGDCE